MNGQFSDFWKSSSGKVIMLVLLTWLMSMAWRYTIHDRPLNVITWDVYGYYAYLPAVVPYASIPAFSFVEEHRSNYVISSNQYQIAQIEPGKRVPIYTIGLAYLWLPFYLIAHLLALIGPWSADGLDAPYQMSILVAAICYGWIGLFFLRKVLLQYFEDRTVSWSLLAIALGTNYFHYITMDSGMPHAPLFSLYAVFLWLVIRAHRKPSFYSYMWLTTIGVLICLIRPSEVILVSLFLLYGADNAGMVRNKMRLFTKPMWIVATIALVILLLAPQIIFWKTGTGQWIFNGYSGHHFDFFEPHLIEGLFSYRKGWLVYTPVMILALLGMFFLGKKARPFRYAIPVFFLINIYIVLSWHIWWYASSFGMRSLVQSYAVLAIPFAAFTGMALNRSNVWRTGIQLFILLAIGLNLFQTWQYEKGILAKDEMNQLFYWEAFGQVTPDKSRFKYLDLDEVYDKKGTAEKEIVKAWRDSSGLSGKNNSVCTHGGNIFSPAVEYFLRQDGNNQWFNVKATVMNRGDLFDKYKVTRLVGSHIRDDKTINWTGVRFPMFVPEDTWQTVEFDIKVEDAQRGDLLRVFLWNTSPDTTCVRDVHIYMYKN